MSWVTCAERILWARGSLMGLCQHCREHRQIFPATENREGAGGNLKWPSGLTLIYYHSLAPMMYQVRS